MELTYIFSPRDSQRFYVNALFVHGVRYIQLIMLQKPRVTMLSQTPKNPPVQGRESKGGECGKGVGREEGEKSGRG